ncbi:unnamed protein product, partial [Rotaria sp. Silwood1]
MNLPIGLKFDRSHNLIVADASYHKGVLFEEENTNLVLSCINDNNSITPKCSERSLMDTSNIEPLENTNMPENVLCSNITLNFDEDDDDFDLQIFDQWSSSCLLNNKLSTVYRGQQLFHDDMIRLQSLAGQHITMSQYISTTKDIQITEMFAGEGQGRPHFESILVFIRLGHLVKHHPPEQLYYYQSVLSIIPSNESALLEVGDWAIRMRCISSVNDWTSVLLSIYRQTVFHIHGDLRKQLHRELARIDEVRGGFHLAKMHCHDALKFTNNCVERQLILSDLERLN